MVTLGKLIEALESKSIKYEIADMGKRVWSLETGEREFEPNGKTLISFEVNPDIFFHFSVWELNDNEHIWFEERYSCRTGQSVKRGIRTEMNLYAKLGLI